MQALHETEQLHLKEQLEKCQVRYKDFQKFKGMTYFRCMPSLAKTGLEIFCHWHTKKRLGCYQPSQALFWYDTYYRILLSSQIIFYSQYHTKRMLGRAGVSRDFFWCEQGAF